MSTWKVILATIVIFTAGMLTGGVMIHQFAKRPSPPPPFQPMVLRKEFLGRMDRELALTRQQREHIEKIMTESQERTRLLWELVGPEMRDEMRLVREEIREQLRPEQLAKFEEIMQRPRRPMEPDPRRPRNSKGPTPLGQSNFQAKPVQERQ